MTSLIERFSQNAESKTSRADFFKLEIGQSAVLRFLSPMVDNYMVNHASAGCACCIEIPQHDWEETKAQTGKNPECPVCHQPFGDNDIITAKEGVRGGGFHYEQGAGYLLCLDDPDNDQPYACPLCQKLVTKEKRDGTKYQTTNTPQDRLVGYAVVCNVKRETGTDGRGLPVETVTGIEDEYIEKNGAMVPHVVIVDQAFSNFWSMMTSKDDDFRDPITYYVWEVQRTDRATYQVNKLSLPPQVVDIERYRPYMTRTLAEYVASKGTPQYYASKGVPMQGDTPEGGAPAVPGYAQGTLAAAAAPAPAPQGQPYQQYAAPAQQYAPQQFSAPAPAPQAQQAAPAQQPAQQFSATAAQGSFMPAPVGAAPQPSPAQPAAAAPAPAPQQTAPAATVPWTDMSGNVGASVYDDGIPF
jgi:hypothetical protein